MGISKRLASLTTLLLLCLSLLLTASSCRITKKTESTTVSAQPSSSMTTTVVTTAAETTEETTANGLFHRNDTFDDSTLPDFWHLVTYVTMKDASNQTAIKDGILTLTDQVVDRAPMLISDPITLKPGEILTVRRKVRLHYANEYFDGAMRITAPVNGELKLIPGTDRWDANLGQIVANVSYLHYFYMQDNKATTDGFVLFNVVDGGMTAEVSLNPVFDEWFTESISYYASSGDTMWQINGETYLAKGIPLKQPAVCVMMNAYGWFTGHSMDIDQIEINIDEN